MTPPPIFFVHIMKTGGSAMGHYLRPRYDETACYPPSEDANFTQKKISIDSILKLSRRERSRIRFYTMHMPAWVAAEVAPQHQRMAVLREPVARTISHLKHIGRGCGIDDLEAIYDDPRWRRRLGNYQTRIFGLRRADHQTRRQAMRRMLVALLTPGERDKFDPLPPGRTIGEYVMYTAMANDRPMDADDLGRAIELVDSFDLVGVTEKLEDFRARLEQVTGIRGEVDKVNVAPQSPQLPDTLIDRIRQDNALDTQLYNHVLSFWS